MKKLFLVLLLFPSLSHASTILNPGSSSADSLTKSSASVSYLGISSGSASSNTPFILTTISTYSASGFYNLTTTTNTIAIGTSSSTITLSSTGTYAIFGRVNLFYSGATFAANQTVTLNIYRQNNTPTVLPNTQTQEVTSVITSITSTLGDFNLAVTSYTTINSNDVLSLHGSITAAPASGNLQATEANLFALRIN